MCTQRFILQYSSHFYLKVIAKTETVNYPSKDELINKLKYIHTTKYKFLIIKKEQTIDTLKIIMLKKKEWQNKEK